MLASRLIAFGFKTIDVVKNLGDELKNEDLDKLASTSIREKSPIWVMHKISRLCHVINNLAEDNTGCSKKRAKSIRLLLHGF